MPYNSPLKKTINALKQKLNVTLANKFNQVNINFPPKKISLLIYKSEQIVELWATNISLWAKISQYPFTAYSGALGPKLHEGDGQIPEGIYHITHLNPQSKFYLSMRINYPNAFDKIQAEFDGRTNLGSDIYIHGKNQTIGCIAIGDEAIEEIFYLAGICEKEEVIIAPYKFKNLSQSDTKTEISWYPQLLKNIHAAIQKYDK